MIWTCALSLVVLVYGASTSVGYQPQSYEVSNAAEGQDIVRIPREIDESVEEAQARLFNVDRAADAVTGIERGVKADPMYVESQTDQITRQLKADIAKYKAAKKNDVARNDENVISLAKRILKIVTTLEVAKFIADSRARQGVEIAQRRGIHRPTAYQFPQYNFGYLYGLPSVNPVQDMTQPYQQPQQDATFSKPSDPTSTVPAPPSPPPPPPLPPLPAIPPQMLVPQEAAAPPPVQQQNSLPGFVPTTKIFMKESSEATSSSNLKPNTPPVKHAPKHHVQPKKPHVVAQKPSGVITPVDRAQWSIFGESLPMAPPAENNPPVQAPQVEQSPVPAVEQFTSTSTTEQPGNPMLQESQEEFSKPSESSTHELPGLRPLDSDLIKHEHHEKKLDLSVKPPTVQMGTQSPSPIQADVSPPVEFTSSPPEPAASPPLDSSAQGVPAAAPPVPPAALDAPLPAPAAPAPAVSSTSPPSSTQMDFSNQMFPSMEPSAVPMPQPQFFGPSLIPLGSVPLPMFLPDDTADVRLAKEKDYETRKSAIAVENIEKAIGLDEQTIESLIDDVKQASQRQTIQYENAVMEDKKEEEEAKGEGKLKTEEKLLRDEELEGKAKETVDQINRLEKVMTVVEAAKFDAQRRAGQQLQVAEAWRDSMYGRAKKSKITKAPEKNTAKKTARHILESIIKREKERKNSNQKNKRSQTKEYRSKRSFASDLDTKDVLRVKFRKIGKLAKEILKNSQSKK